MKRYVRIQYGLQSCYAEEADGYLELLTGTVPGNFCRTGLRIDPSQVTRFLPPVLPGKKILGIGRNYNRPEFTPEDIPKVPKVFLKSSSAIVCDGEAIVLTPMNEDVIAEPEIAFLIGKDGSHIPEERAMEYVAGYLVVNDVTDRALLKQDGGEWTRGKSTDTFLPMGKYLVADIDGADLCVACQVNGTEVVSGNTADLIFPIPRLVSFISHFMRLEAGDIVMTGTPRGPVIHPGDRVRVTVEHVGEIENPVVFCGENWNL